MRTSDFDYHLPPERIAQHPVEPRDSSRLLVLRRDSGSIEHRGFQDILEYLMPGDVLVFNDSRVIPARLKGKRDNGGAAEVMLLRRLGDNLWEALVKPGKRLRPGAVVEIDGDASPPLTAEIKEVLEGGIRIVSFSDESRLPLSGEMPLPPYIRAPLQDQERYQTVYARVSGSVAAPTAGLHFTPELLKEIAGRGVDCRFVTLHVGLDTFRPVTEEDPRQHVIHREFGVLDEATAAALAAAKQEGRRIICVGTTSVRLTEQAARAGADGTVQPFRDWADLFILPGHRFRVADAMITNFHLPRSSLMMLVSAFAGKDNIDKAYAAAIAENYRFYSFGDAMLIL